MLTLKERLNVDNALNELKQLLHLEQAVVEEHQLAIDRIKDLIIDLSGLE